MSTFIKISTITVGAGGSTSIDFTSIPATYTDLLLKVSARAEISGSGGDMNMKFNGSGGTAYSERSVFGTGSATASENFTSQAYIPRAGFANKQAYTASVFANSGIYISNYASANYKSVSINSVSENNATEAYAGLFAGLWADTSAINQITLTMALGDFDQYSSATLYGIKSS